MKFLDADVKRPLASVSAIVDEGNVVKFGPQDPMSRRDGVFVVQLEAQAMMSNVTTDSVKLMETEMTGSNETMRVRCTDVLWHPFCTVVDLVQKRCQDTCMALAEMLH